MEQMKPCQFWPPAREKGLTQFFKLITKGTTEVVTVKLVCLLKKKIKRLSIYLTALL